MKKAAQLKKIAAESLKPIKKISVAEWAETYRMLPSTSAEPGLWRTDRVPYAREIMNAFTEPDIRRVVAMTAAQVSKTEIILNIIGRFAHLDPCNIMMMQPTLEMAQDISKDRLSKMIRDTKVLTPLFLGEGSKSRNSDQTILSKIFVGGRLVMTGANSSAGLASRPIRILLCDEVDRFPVSAGNHEGDPVKLATARTTTYWNAKIGLFSTPTLKNSSRIEQEYLKGTQEEWQHRCPNCGEWHRFKLQDFLESEKLWKCPDCGLTFDEQAMKSAEQKYVAQNLNALKNGIRSFWVSGFSSPWLTWQQIFEEWQEAKGKPELETVVYNTRFAESYEQVGELSDGGKFLERLENYAAELPSAVLLLTAAVDVQANRLEFEVAGWGEGEERYGIWRGVILGAPTMPETWTQLDAVLNREYSFSDGRKLKIARTFVDSGFATKSVYDYCARRSLQGVFAIKGRGAPGMPLIHQYTSVAGYGIRLVILGVNEGKQEIFSRLQIDQKGAMYMHFPNDDTHFSRGYDEVYFKQLTAEHKVVKRSGGVSYMAWEPIKKGVRNESLDLACYNLCAMKSMHVDWQRLKVEVRGSVDNPVQAVKKIVRKIQSVARDVF